MKVLNLYAGIGGNRKLWKDVDVTAVEIEPKIAKIYQEFFPDDTVIVADAHQYLLEHYNDGWDFIWSSPPCPTHSCMRFLKKEQGAKDVYPDMRLYQEIIFLKTWFKGKWCIENVISYYEPLIKPYECENHYFWSNFVISPLDKKKRGLIRTTTDNRIKFMEGNYNIDLSNFDISKSLKSKIISNCVKPVVGKHVFDCAFRLQQKPLLEG